MAEREGAAQAGSARVRAASEVSEGDLVRAFREGDREAFARLVGLHERSVVGLALRLTGSLDEARDLAQEAFVRAWIHRERFDASRPFAPWVLAIVRRLGVDRLRRRARWQEGALPETLPAPQGAAKVEAGVVGEERSLALERALATLRPHYRAVIELHHLQGRPVAEIAEILDRPPGTVMTWLYRARAALRDRLEAEGISP